MILFRFLLRAGDKLPRYEITEASFVALRLPPNNSNNCRGEAKASPCGYYTGLKTHAYRPTATLSRQKSIKAKVSLIM